MSKAILTAAWICAALGLSTLARAQDPGPAPIKVTHQSCGGYTIQLCQNGFGDPPDTASLLMNGVTLAQVSDISVSLDFCRDLTGDGIPEVMLTGSSGGGEPCYFTQNLYSLTNPPRRILNAFSGETGALIPQQLDGAGPLELLGGDWRFASHYGLPFYGSPPLRQIYSYIGGQYVDHSRAYPGVSLRSVSEPTAQTQPGQALSDYAALWLTGQTERVKTYLSHLPPSLQTWLANYGPDLRQKLSDYGMTGWPTRAGADPDAPRTGIGGSFSAAGRAEYLAIVDQNGQVALRLYRPQAGEIVAGPTLETRARSMNKYENLNWWPAFTVRRATGRDDAVIYDADSGSTTYPVYRLSATSAKVLKDDALSVAATLLADLQSLAERMASEGAAQPRAGQTGTDIARRIDAAVSRAQSALALSDFRFDPRTLVKFEVLALKMPQDGPETAQVVAPVTFGLVTGDQNIDSVDGKRSTVTVDLVKGSAGWTVTRWGLKERLGEPYGLEVKRSTRRPHDERL